MIGDARIYAFPGATSSPNGNGQGSSSDISKILLSTSGLAVVNTLLEEGKLGALISQVGQLVAPDHVANPTGNSSGNSDPQAMD